MLKSIAIYFFSYPKPSEVKEKERQCPENGNTCNDYCKQIDGDCVHDCLKLPNAIPINGNHEGKGCAGAVKNNGVFDEMYCKGKSYAGGEDGPVAYPWWASCCYWDVNNNKCTPKGGKFNELDKARLKYSFK